MEPVTIFNWSFCKMKMVLLLVVCAILVASQSSQTQFVIDPKPKYCNRRMSLDAAAEAKFVTITANAACVEKYTNVNSTSIQLQLTSGNRTRVYNQFPSSIPTFALGTKFLSFPVDPAKKSQGNVHFTYLSFDQYVFYQDVDGQVGYNPAVDTVLKRQYLNDSLATTNKFDSYIKSSVDLDGNGNSHHKFTVQILREFATTLISTSVEMSSLDIYPFNSSTTLKYFTPNAMRFTAKIDGVTNFPALASGCAISVVVCAPVSAFRPKSIDTMSVNQTKDYPQDTNLDQVAWQLDDAGLINATFFSVRKSVKIVPTTKAEFTTPVYWTQPVSLGQAVDSGLPLVNGTHTFWRIWLSVPQTAAVTDSYKFEASYGFDEIGISSATSMAVSLLVVLLMALFY